MEIVLEVASTSQHFKQILQLQKQNLFSAISEEQQAQQGFVFAEHTMSLLQTMAAHLPQVIAVSNGNVIGYNLAMPVSMKMRYQAWSRCLLSLNEVNIKAGL